MPREVALRLPNPYPTLWQPFRGAIRLILLRSAVCRIEIQDLYRSTPEVRFIFYEKLGRWHKGLRIHTRGHDLTTYLDATAKWI